MPITIPLSGSDVRIYSNVPFTRDYQHVRWFDNATDRNTYFNNKTPIHSANNVSFVKHTNSQGIYKCLVQLELLQSGTYMTFDNEGQTYYCFIDDLEYINDGCTHVYFTIDIFQTHRFKMTFYESLVEREHTTRYSNNIPVINTIPEQLNYGEAYETKEITRIQPYDGLQFMVIVCKQAFHQGGTQIVTPTNNGVPQPFTYYIHPFYTSGESPEIMIGGQGATYSTLQEVLETMYNQQNAVENVVSMYVTDNPGLALFFDGQTIQFNLGQAERVEFVYNSKIGATVWIKQSSSYTSYIKNLGSKYSGVTQYPESKLMMYPYTVYYLTDLKGKQIEIRPENIISNQLQLLLRGSLGTLNKTSYQVINYNHNNIVNGQFEEYNNALISNEPSQVPVVSDYLSAYLQGNANSLQANRDATLINSVFGLVGSTVGAVTSAATMNPLGTVANIGSAVNTTKDGLLSFKAQNAQLKDIANIPPNVNSQGSNINFDIGNDFNGVYLIKKQLKPEYVNILTDYFEMFGYAVNLRKVPNLKTRQRFNYVKCMKANIVGNVPHQQLNELKQIFENGVTLWHTDDMLNYTLPNNER